MKIIVDLHPVYPDVPADVRYRACLVRGQLPELYSNGLTPQEAIGNLVTLHPELFQIEYSKAALDLVHSEWNKITESPTSHMELPTYKPNLNK